MRLLNVNTIALEEFQGGPKYAYAIPSHTWGEEEVSFQDFVSGRADGMKGLSKILGCCQKARSEGYRYVWIDTCCIDKRSSSEISEAINSMLKWYQDAEVCYAYLFDFEFIPPGAEGAEAGTGGDVGNGIDANNFARYSSDEESEPFLLRRPRECRWFNRGWTLQELLAPSEVVFLASDWREIGTRDSLCADVAEFTGIDTGVLQHRHSWTEFSVAQRMAWAAGRRSTRIEDEAYCLMGLFGVNMPLLYGEGQKAFKRLQLEIMRESYDPSILACASVDSPWTITGVLAPSPAAFEDCGDVDWGMPVHSGNEPFGNSKLCHDIIGSSMRMDAPVVELRSGIVGAGKVVFRADLPSGDEARGSRGEKAYFSDAEILRSLSHFPKAESHTSFDREFDYNLYIRNRPTVAFVILDGCRKQRRHTIGITLCTDSTGLLKRLHYPTRFLLPGSGSFLHRSHLRTLHLSLSGTEMLQQPNVPNWTRFPICVPDLTGTPYALSHTILPTAKNAGDCWYLDRWGEAWDHASLTLQPCFSLRTGGLSSRALAFAHQTDASESFLLVFILPEAYAHGEPDDAWFQVGIERGQRAMERLDEHDLPVLSNGDVGVAQLFQKRQRDWEFKLTPSWTLTVRIRKGHGRQIALLGFRGGADPDQRRSIASPCNHVGLGVSSFPNSP